MIGRARRPSFMRITLSLGLLIAASAVVPSTIGAHGRVVAPKDTSCLPNFATYQRHLFANYPVGSTTGTTYLAAGVESTKLTTSGWVRLWRGWFLIGGDTPRWVRTTRTYFPKGLFKNGFEWQRGKTFLFPLVESGSWTHHRVRWQVKWPDGHRQYLYSNWVIC